MRIGELAQRVGINPKTVRYYEQIGLLPEPPRTPSGYREYADVDVERVMFIKSAQRLGLALDEIREILALRDGGQRPCAYVRAVLRQQVTDIDHRLAELQQLRQQLITLEQRAEALPEPDGAICGLIDHVRQRTTPVDTARPSRPTL